MKISKTFLLLTIILLMSVGYYVFSHSNSNTGLKNNIVHDNYFGDVKKTESKSEEDSRLKQGIDQKNSIISIHLKPETSVADITILKNLLENQQGVDSVVYTSAEQALVGFKERHKDDTITLKALEELGKNPMGATFVLKLSNSSIRESILKKVETSTQFKNIESII